MRQLVDIQGASGAGVDSGILDTVGMKAMLVIVANSGSVASGVPTASLVRDDGSEVVVKSGTAVAAGGASTALSWGGSGPINAPLPRKVRFSVPGVANATIRLTVGAAG